MGIPEASWSAPSPARILLENVGRNKTLVLNDERNSHQVGQQPLGYQAGFEVVGNDESRGQSGVGVEPGDAHRMVVIPHQAGALVVRVVVGARPGKNRKPGYIHET